MVFIQNEDLKDLCGKYEKFTEKTIIGEFGKTAQFSMVYVKLVQVFFNPESKYSYWGCRIIQVHITENK